MNSKNAGYIYVVQMVGTIFYKIGRSNNVPRRMSQIGIQLPTPYHLCFAYRVSQARFVEGDLHQDFRSYHRNGEWFELSETGVQLIKARLLSEQCEGLTIRVVEKFLNSAHSSANLIRFGGLITKLGWRFERRLQVKHDLAVALLRELPDEAQDDVLSAEYVG